MSSYDSLNDTNLMGWDDTLDNDGDYVLLPEGDYNFVVTNLERGRFPGGAKLPPCNKATIYLNVKSPEGSASVKTDLILYRTMEWKLSAFFRCIGQKKHGERLIMDWNHVTGSKGRAHFRPRSYTGNDGEQHQVNDVASFIDYDPKFFPEEAEWVKDAEQNPPEEIW